MISSKKFARNFALAGALALLVGSSADAQDRNRQRRVDARQPANRYVEGTVASVVRERGGDRVRLTNGMDVVVPNAITGQERGRRFGAATLEPGDQVRMEVYSQEGDGRDARVRSLEVVQRNGVYGSDRRLIGNVVSYNKRSGVLVVETDGGRTIDVDARAFADRNTGRAFRRGDRVSISGRMDRGMLMADDVTVSSARRR